MSTLYVDTINEKTSGNGIYIPGHVSQVVIGANTSSVSTTSGTDAPTGVKVTITPSSTQSKIYISSLVGVQNDGANGGTYIKLYRKIGSGSAAQILPTSGGASGLYEFSDSNHIQQNGFVFLDSPSTTSSVEYEIYYARYNAGTSYVFVDSQIVAMEIGG